VYVSEEFELDAQLLLKNARIALQDAESRTVLAKGMAKAATIEALGQGYTEAQISRLLKVNRLTVRRWLGK
jgi:hypothetical protein